VPLCRDWCRPSATWGDPPYHSLADTARVSSLAATRRVPLSFRAMGISQPQNLRTPPIEKLRPYGVRVSLPVGDPFRKLLGPEWHRLHWYPTPAERDAALVEMGRRHQYSRAGDKPSLVFEKVENLAQSRGL
jgi:hypothetical protein